MNSTNTPPVVDFKQQARFEELRDQLLAANQADRLNKPLAFWTVSSDRRLPLVFLGRSVHDLMTTPFEQLCKTPGVGKKKITTLLELLERVCAVGPFLGADGEENGMTPEVLPHEEGFNPDAVSETVWERWRDTVRRHDLGRETLGRFAETLQELPRVIWRRQLDAYTELTLAQIRSLRTHGEKRVRAIIEVFGALQTIFDDGSPVSHLAVRVVPRVVDQVETWLGWLRRRDMTPSVRDVRRSFVDPLLAQVRLDVGDTVADLVSSRLNLDGEGATVRQAAKHRGLTRARVYQLLSEVNEVMQVRWPEGELALEPLRERFAGADDDPAAVLFNGMADLLFPRRRGSDNGDNGGEPGDDEQDAVSSSHLQAG